MEKFKKIFYLGEEFILERGKAIPEDGIILDLGTLKSYGSIAEGFSFSGFFGEEKLDFRVRYEDGCPVEIEVYNVDTFDYSDSWSSIDTYYLVS